MIIFLTLSLVWYFTKDLHHTRYCVTRGFMNNILHNCYMARSPDICGLNRLHHSRYNIEPSVAITVYVFPLVAYVHDLCKI